MYVQGSTYVLYAREGYNKHRILNVNYSSLDVRFPIYTFTWECIDKCTFNAVHMYSNLEEGTRAGELYKKHRILCWVLTGPANHEARNINLDNN